MGLGPGLPHRKARAPQKRARHRFPGRAFQIKAALSQLIGRAQTFGLPDNAERPVCVGFGINKPQHLRQLQGIADGAIVGSAFVRRVREHLSESPEKIAAALEIYCKELLSDVRGEGEAPAEPRRSVRQEPRPPNIRNSLT